MQIRPYEQKYKDNVRFVCLYCDGPEDISDSTQHFLLTTYCDYYIERESGNCFVAVNDEDEAIGYIICTENYDRFDKIFREEFLTRIPEEEKTLRYYAENSDLLQRKYKDCYPAHLHIDILPEYQRMGIGNSLIHTLTEHLKSKGIKGVMLSVSSDNLKGIAFYEKCGFTLLEKCADMTAFGMLLG